jgi:hypothetical protein
VFDGTSTAATSSCFQPSISEDGNVIVFYTAAMLVAADTNTKIDVYARVINDGTGTSRTLLVSAKRDTIGPGNFIAPADGDSKNPNVSGDGGTVVYQSTATNLLPPPRTDANGVKSDIFVATLTLGAVNPFGPNDIVSVNSGGQQSISPCFDGFTASSLASHTPRYINRDGMGVLFHGRPCDWTFALCPARDDSIAPNRCPGDCTGPCTSSTPSQVYFRDRAINQTFLVSRAVRAGGTPGTFFFVASNGISRGGTINGARVLLAYSSKATNLQATGFDSETFSDVYLINPDLESLLDTNGNPNNPIKVSQPPGAAFSNGDSYEPVISCASTAPRVVFTSLATNLIAGTNTSHHIYMRDLIDETPGTPLYFKFSVASTGIQGNGNSDNPDASCDCLVALYESVATNLIASDTNGLKDVFETLSFQGNFIRGDAENDNDLDVNDATFIGNFLSAGGATPDCLDAADTNNDGVINNTDVAFLSNFLLHCDTNPPPPAPFPACGVDTLQMGTTIGDALTCSEHDCMGSFVCVP